MKEGSNADQLIVAVAKNLTTILQQPCDCDDESLLGVNTRCFLFAEMSYSMVASYLGKDLGYGSKLEAYQYEDTKVALRYWPVVSVANVWRIDNEQGVKLTDTDKELLTVDTDYELSNGKFLVLKDIAFSDSISHAFMTGEDADYWNRINVLVEYEGGWTIDNIPRPVRSGLLQQSIALYNRSPALGTAQITNPNDSSLRLDAYDLDAGDLVESVKTMLEPFVYSGRAIEWDV